MGSLEDANQPAKARAARARGEGSIWQDGKTGRWWYAISLDGKQRKYRAPSKQAAAARLKQLKEELDQGVKPGHQVKLGIHAQKWMEKVVSNLKAKTQRFYRQISEHYLLPYLGENTPIKKIGAEAIGDMLNAMRRAGYADQTVRHAYTVGRTVFEQARKWRAIAYNPFDLVDPPEVKVIDPVPLDVAEVEALRQAVIKHRLMALYELSWSLGIRKGELLGLSLDGLDLQAGTIEIKQQVLDLEKGRPQIMPYTKNDEQRTLPLTPRLITLLRVRLEMLLAERKEGWEEHGLLFPSENGTPMTQRNLDRHFKAACVRAGVRLKDTGKKRSKGRGENKRDVPILTSTLHFHHLRHTCLSWLGDTGASDKILKAIAGHADKNVTDRYIHIGLVAMRNAVVALERAMLQTPASDSSAEAEVG